MTLPNNALIDFISLGLRRASSLLRLYLLARTLIGHIFLADLGFGLGWIRPDPFGFGRVSERPRLGRRLLCLTLRVFVYCRFALRLNLHDFIALLQKLSGLLHIDRLVFLFNHGCTFILTLPFAGLEEIVFLGCSLPLLLL